MSGTMLEMTGSIWLSTTAHLSLDNEAHGMRFSEITLEWVRGWGAKNNENSKEETDEGLVR